MKLDLDKYYTNKTLAKKCIDVTYKVIGLENITEVIEPSAGNGSFSNQIPNCIAFDIQPEANNIIKQDFLKLNISYKKGRLFIGNPPFGEKNNLSRAFYNKCTELGDYIAFILPISQLNNTDSLYKFDLIYSEDLGNISYSDRNIHCCFNIYKRPEDGLNDKYNLNLKDITIYRDDYKGLINGKTYKDFKDYDLVLCRRGFNTGKIKTFDTDKSSFKIIINNKNLKDEIISKILNHNWKTFKNHQSAPAISKLDILRMLVKEIPNIT